MSDRTSESASHFCRICGAWWLCSWDGTWQLKSEQAGEDCCNNQPMHGNTHLVSVRAALEAIGNIAGRGDADRLRAELAAEREKNELLQAELRQRRDDEPVRFLEWRGIDVSGRKDIVCRRCGGSGVYLYGNTSTWRGGVGGAALRYDCCNQCWGSGTNRPWPSHAAIDAARKDDPPQERT